MATADSDVLKKSIRYLKGVGQARALLFNKLGIFTIEDALYYFPRDYEDRSNLKLISELVDGESCAFEGIISSPVSETRPRRGLSIQKMLVRDRTGTIMAVWFNQGYLKNSFKQGEKHMFFGKITRKFRSFEVLNPVHEKIEEGELKNTCRIVPIYPSTAGLTQNIIRSVIRAAIDAAGEMIEENLSEDLKNRYELCDLEFAIRNIHFPVSDAAFKAARRRLVFEELFLLQLALSSIKNIVSDATTGIVFSAKADTEEMIKKLPFTLTSAQKRVFNEIESDMESPKLMNRLVQGDVGSGKTIVAVLALYKAVKSGWQGAFMAPTEILADQHYKTVNSLLAGTNIRIEILTGHMTGKNKNAVLERLKNGEVDILIGTHALLEQGVEFSRLGLIVTDEQHRFGVRQRAELSKKGENPDMLVMTATPIPRTLALILYGDLDISVIDELPPGRKPVETYAVDNSMRPRIDNFIRKKVTEGRQVFIVCPLVEESDTIEAKSAVEYAERIARNEFSGLKVGLMHGKLKASDKENVMDRFIKGELDILVSTTVIEVGVNIPNASVMVVENAERFGLAQLHQLRGRVGRGEYQSYCILYNESKTEIAKQRMKVMQSTNDGFVISEKDLELRGPGEFFGTRQHGIPELRIANLYKDIDILKLAQEAATQLIKADKQLELPENRYLRDNIKKRFNFEVNGLSMN